MGLQYARGLTDALKAQISVENLFNQTVIFQPGYPMPGRYFQVRFQYYL
jgi:outer membrane receptor protein involved in Fe transport